ncbi:MAG TPA: anti-sigma factor [Solirubrobacteraceae bacterium]|nr:anti-sigma factor [Solirubrobacteraceae bacterium]
MSEKRDCGADAAAYVLGALEHDEAEAFCAHMANCGVCRDEVSAFQDVADALALAAPPQPVPHGLKRRVMASVRAEPRGSAAAGEQKRKRRRPSIGFFSTMPASALALSAVAAVVVIAVGAVALFSGGGSSATRVYSAHVSWPGNAQLRVSGNRGELIVRGMPAPPPNKVYEVWLLKRGSKTPSATAALFSPTSSGSGSVDVPGNLNDITTVLVTPEPAGGSPAPTHAPILQAQIS